MRTRRLTTQLPADLEQYVKAKVQSGRFSSSDEAITEALRLLRKQEEADEARTMQGIQQGLEDMRAGRGRPADEVFAEIRRDLGLSPDP
jgi:antitoxin ParD1/3/4